MRAAKLSALVFYSGVCACIASLCGCVLVDIGEFLTPGGKPSDKQIVSNYEQTELKVSRAADVLTQVHMPEYELLSKSKSIIACQGKKRRKWEIWFNAVAFDENELTAKRKYLFIVNERPKKLFTEPWQGVRFDCETVLEGDVLDEPYANENARRVAILKRVLDDFRKDMDEVSSDNKKLKICRMMVNQSLETVLLKLDSSPALASKLSEPEGVSFSHINLDRGRIQMTRVDDVVKIKMRLGSFTKKFIGERKYKCSECGYIYDPVAGDPEHGVKPGTSFKDLPDNWVCPGCGAGKKDKTWVKCGRK